MPGLPKILVLVIIIVVIWQAFKIIGRVQKARIAEAQARVREAKAQSRNPRQTRTQAATTRTGVAETRECPVCGAYVAQGSGACGKPRCPFGS